MGTVTTTIEVGGPQGRNFRRIEVEVDTGSTYTALPREMLQALEVPVTRTVPSRLADRTEKPAQVGYANIKLAGAELITPVIFAEDGEPSLLGVISLEDALLAVDPVNNQLIPVAAKRYWTHPTSNTDPKRRNRDHPRPVPPVPGPGNHPQPPRPRPGRRQRHRRDEPHRPPDPRTSNPDTGDQTTPTPAMLEAQHRH